jgi:CheY-like chemotaxis protein
LSGLACGAFSTTPARSRSAPDREQAAELIRSVGDFDVIVIDIRSRAAGSSYDLKGADAIHELRKAEPAPGIVAHGDRAERYMARRA